MNVKYPPGALVGSLMVFAVYVLVRMIWSQEGETYIRSTSVFSALALTAAQTIYLLYFIAEVKLSSSRISIASSLLMSVAVLLLIPLNWMSGLISTEAAVVLASVATLFVIAGAVISWLEGRSGARQE